MSGWRGVGLALAGLLAAPAGPAAEAAGGRPTLAGVTAWAVVYAREVDPARLRPFELLVVDPDVAAPPAALKRAGCRLLAYLSLGEGHRSRAYFRQAEVAGWLVRENPAWPGSFLVDVRQEGWRRTVLGELAPAILGRGFDGLFLDTLDTAEVLEAESPARYAGSVRQMAALVQALRAHYPAAILLPNNAFQVLEHIAPDVDGLVAESVFATYDSSAKRYLRVPTAARQQKVALLTDVRRRHRLPVFTIEYAPASDRELAGYAFAAARAAGFIPYVTSIDLQEVQAPPP